MCPDPVLRGSHGAGFGRSVVDHVTSQRFPVVSCLLTLHVDLYTFIHVSEEVKLKSFSCIEAKQSLGLCREHLYLWADDTCRATVTVSNC